MNEIDRLKNKLKQEREKNKQLKEEFRIRKREILKELDIMKERVKDLMYIGDLDERKKYYYYEKKTKEK